MEQFMQNQTAVAPLSIIAIIFGNYFFFIASRHPAIMIYFALPNLTFAVWFIMFPRIFKL